MLRLSVAGAALAAMVAAQDPARGRIVDDVKCAADPTQSYALYVPAAYTPERAWPVLIGFHPGARGRAIVEKYQAAAAQYGYVVAGSNNSRNGPWAVSAAAVRAMVPDLGTRFSLDPKRVYLTGLSGGARVATEVALAGNSIAGVVASSAGYPDAQPRKSVPFAVFSTAGTEDFNYIEMRTLDNALTSPHRLAVFEGGHALPPDDVALEAIEWLEIQALKSGRKAPDTTFVDRVFAKRQSQIAAAATPVIKVRLLGNLVEDFKGLHDVSTSAAELEMLSKQPDVKKALGRQRDDDNAEISLMTELLTLERNLKDDSQRGDAMATLRDKLTKTSRAANAKVDSPERQRSRRVLRSLTMGASERVQDAQYLKMLEQFRPAGPGRRMS